MSKESDLIVHLPEGGYRIGPGNLGAVLFQSAGMGHQLQAIVQTAIGFHVSVFFPAVDYVQDRAGVRSALPGTIYF